MEEYNYSSSDISINSEIDPGNLIERARTSDK
jgi:hypothetical protein